MNWGLGRLRHLSMTWWPRSAWSHDWCKAFCYLPSVTEKSSTQNKSSMNFGFPSSPIPSSPFLLRGKNDNDDPRIMCLLLVSLDSTKPVYKYSLWKGLERGNKNIENYSYLKNNKLNSWVHLWPQPTPKGDPGEETPGSAAIGVGGYWV